jgi:hypothetical protein
MTFAEVVLFCGYFASGLVFATFFMRGRARLRQVAIASNVAFITYGIIGGVIPVLTLHALLLPLNIWRLREISETHRAILAALSGDALHGCESGERTARVGPNEAQPRTWRGRESSRCLPGPAVTSQKARAESA